MRGTWITLLVVAAACGGGNGSGTDGGSGDDVPGPDAVEATCSPVSGTNVVVREIATVSDAAIIVTAPVGDSRLFVGVRDGNISIIQNEELRDEPFLDVSDRIEGGSGTGNEQGLLGLAFHPDYATNGKFYVYYTTDTDDVVDEYQRMAGDPSRADPATRRQILAVPDFAGNHNGGMMEFGSDGYLYISTGDGGGGGDPERTAQDLDRLLGKMLRIDVDNPGGGREYGIPSTNPYAGGGGAPEVYMYGLRNPWRWSFDRANGDIYIGDVGQSCAEEIDVISAANAPGADFGWSDCEGLREYYAAGGCAAPGGNRVAPVYQEIRSSGEFPGCSGPSNWASVIGGEVYRGSCYPDLVGRYFYTDYSAGGLYSFVYAGGQATDIVEHSGSFGNSATSIHADALGELYIGYENGRISHIEVQ